MLTPCIARYFQYMKHVPRIRKNYPKITPIWRKNLDKAVLPQKIFRYSGVNHGVLEAMKAPATVGWVFAAMTVPKHASATHTKPLFISRFYAVARRELPAYFPAYPALRRKPKVFASYLRFLHLWFCSWSHAPPTTTPSRDDAGNYDSLVGFGCRDQ